MPQVEPTPYDIISPPLPAWSIPDGWWLLLAVLATIAILLWFTLQFRKRRAPLQLSSINLLKNQIRSTLAAGHWERKPAAYIADCSNLVRYYLANETGSAIWLSATAQELKDLRTSAPKKLHILITALIEVEECRFAPGVATEHYRKVFQDLELGCSLAE